MSGRPPSRASNVQAVSFLHDSTLPRFLQTSIAFKIIFFITLFGAFALHVVPGYFQLESFAFGKMDSALYFQGLWMIGHLQNPASLAYNGYLYNVYLGQHVMPIAFLYGLLMNLGPHLLSEIFLEGVSYVVAVYFVYKSSELVWHSRWIALVLSILYWAVFIPTPGHFYFENLAAPAVALATYLTVREDYARAVVAWLIVPLFKEYFAIVSFGMGIYIFFKTAKRLGLLLSATSLAYFLVAFLLVEPWAQPHNADVDLFAYLGSSPSEIVRNFFFEPQRWLYHVASLPALKYLFDMGVPFAGMILLSPTMVLPVLPILGLNLLLPGTQEVTGHYTVAFLPVIAVAGMMGIRRFWIWTESPLILPRILRIGIVLIIALSAISGVRYHLYYLKRAFVGYQILSQHSGDVRLAIANVPSSASVAATDQLMPYFSGRSQLINLGNFSFQRPVYVVLDAAYTLCLPQMLEDALSSNQTAKTLSCYSTENWRSRFEASGDGAKWESAGYRIKHQFGSTLILVENLQ